MRVTFYVAAFFAIICSLQHMVLAEDSEKAPDERPDESGSADEKAPEAKEVPEDEVEPSAGHYDPESEEYAKHMEEISRVADEENKKLGKEKVPLSEHDKAAFAEMEKLMHSEEAPPESEGNEKPDADAGIEIKDQEKGMDNPPEEEEEVVILPTKYPEINAEMTHVNYVDPDAVNDDGKASEVHLTLEYSFFKGADKYELCGNCIIKDGKRANTEGEVKSFTKEDPLFCETSPACFAEFKWTSGAHAFSMRAHTEKGYTDWSPNYNFRIEREVGPVTHVHEDL